VLIEIDDQDGVVLSDPVKLLGWRVGKAKEKGAVSTQVMQEVRAKIKALLIFK
jgi:mRNA-degrading endonuclease toxin of MazEF toxin-antitoxin module